MRKFIVAAMTVVALSACNMEKTTSEKQEAARDSIMDRANARVPIPNIDNFVTRETIAEYMKRMDEPNKTFFVYVVANTGNIIGYYVANGPPVNICSFLAPPDKAEYWGNGGTTVRSAPGVDGVYYSGGGCDTDYFLDAQSDALIQVKGLNLFVSDQPLNVDAEPIKVE